jgi:hypothetical protein
LVERKSESGIFGRDFVSGGLRDYSSKSKEGFWIIAKNSPTYPKWKAGEEPKPGDADFALKLTSPSIGSLNRRFQRRPSATLYNLTARIDTVKITKPI